MKCDCGSNTYRLTEDVEFYNGNTGRIYNVPELTVDQCEACGARYYDNEANAKIHEILDEYEKEERPSI